MAKSLPSTIDQTSFHILRNLLDGWFHQDFDINGPDLETIVTNYVCASPQERVRGAISDIKRFIDLYGQDDSTLQDAVERVLNPDIIIEGWEGMTTREWLLRLEELLSTAKAKLLANAWERSGG